MHVIGYRSKIKITLEIYMENMFLTMSLHAKYSQASQKACICSVFQPPFMFLDIHPH